MALAKRPAQDVATMPPPPFKKIKRPSTVLDEDDYTSALSEIIARDYFPGVAENYVQQEYLAALESGNSAWIAETSKKLRDVAVGSSKAERRTRRMKRDETYTHSNQRGGLVPDTPRGFTGNETPRSVVSEDTSEVLPSEYASKPTTASLSLSEFQVKYTSEDNESFNTVLDKQNLKIREKHAYLWTPDQRILTAKQIAHRTQEQKLLTDHADQEAKAGKALIPLTSGATDSRNAKPDSWKTSRPDNNFMFTPTSVDEQGLPTIQEARELASKAGAKEIVHANTRFPPIQYLDDINPNSIPPSPSLNTDIIAARDLARTAKQRAGSSSDVQTESSFPGNETPRVNGYAFVDEDEPDPNPATVEQPSYRDLLAGQASSANNPFKISNLRKREELHHHLVARDNEKKRSKDLMGSENGGTPVGAGKSAGNMTPAARMLMRSLGKTPLAGTRKGDAGQKEMWTPMRTPRRNDISVGGGKGSPNMK